MSRKPIMPRKLFTISLLLILGSFFTITSVSSQTVPKPSGSLWVSGQVTLNGLATVSGLTVLSESQIKTLKDGEATVNLGRFGRIKLGPQTDLTLHFSEKTIGGKLSSGQAVVSAPAGVGIEITTAEGVVLSKNTQPALLTIGATLENISVAANRGEAKIISGDKVEAVAMGEEVTVSARKLGQPARHKRLLPGVVAGTAVAGSLSTLVTEGVNSTLANTGITTSTNPSTTSQSATAGTTAPPPGMSVRVATK